MSEEVASTLSVGPGGTPMLNRSGLADTVIEASASMAEVAAAMSRWVDNARSASHRSSMFDRGTFTPPENFYDELRAARAALVSDDIVSGVAEITEAFAFQGVKWEADNAEDADIFNQMARDVDLDSYIRKVWREEYAVGQQVTAMVWGWKEYTVRGHSRLEDSADGRPRRRGPKRKKKYRVWCPTSLHVLDSSKVVPVDHGPLGTEKLAWCSTRGEVTHWTRAQRGLSVDPLMAQFFTEQYLPGEGEKGSLALLGVDPDNLLLMNPDMVWRHTTTRPDYELFAPVRLKSCFGLLDLKRQLIASDRASLVGSANYILLIRKGNDAYPAQNAEMANLQENYNFIAKMPVVIADHRLSIDIIAPKTDLTLQADKYDVVDTRILARLLGTLSLGGRGQRNETNVTLSRAVARSMENRRHMLKRALERQLARAVVEHPKNRRPDGSPLFESEPNLVYAPRNIPLDIDAAMIQAIMGLRTQKEISRETVLEYFGLDQVTEAQRRELEEVEYDDIFQTVVPFSSPAQGGTGEAPSQSGPRGGRPVGGGDSSQNPAEVKPVTPRGNPSTTKEA